LSILAVCLSLQFADLSFHSQSGSQARSSLPILAVCRSVHRPSIHAFSNALAQVVRSRGDCEDARMFLRGFKEALPQAWLAAEQRVEMERKGEVDLLEEEEREKLQNEDLDELLEVALDTELRGSFVPFQEGDGDDPEGAAEESGGARRPYSLNPVPGRLERDLQQYEKHRCVELTIAPVEHGRSFQMMTRDGHGSD
jgi:hypothetical protein